MEKEVVADKLNNLPVIIQVVSQRENEGCLVTWPYLNEEGEK